MYTRLRKRHGWLVSMLLLAVMMPVLPFIMVLTVTTDYANAYKVMDNNPMAPHPSYKELWLICHRIYCSCPAGESYTGEEGEEYAIPDDSILLNAFGYIQVMINSGAHTIAYGGYGEASLSLPYVGGATHQFAVNVGLDYGVDLGAAGQSYNEDKHQQNLWFPNVNYPMEEGGHIKIVYDIGAEAHDALTNQVWRYQLAMKH